MFWKRKDCCDDVQKKHNDAIYLMPMIDLCNLSGKDYVVIPLYENLYISINLSWKYSDEERLNKHHSLFRRHEMEVFCRDKEITFKVEESWYRELLNFTLLHKDIPCKSQ